MKTAIIVINWNCANDTIKCIESLERQSSPCTIILVDNASKQQDISLLESYVDRKKTHSILLLKNKTNVGFSGGMNTGIRYALDHGYTYIGTLNPDAIADKHWLEELLACFNKPDVFIAVGALIQADGMRFESTGELYSSWGLPFSRDNGLAANSRTPLKPGYVFAASGGAVVYRSDLFSRIGMFDDTFFMYYEDFDISYRAQLAGLRVYFTPKARAVHARGMSSNKVSGLTTYQAFKNLPLLFFKNNPLPILIWILPRFVAIYCIFIVNGVLKGKGVYVVRGVCASIRLAPHCFRMRHNTQQSRQVSIKYIWSQYKKGLPPR